MLVTVPLDALEPFDPNNPIRIPAGDDFVAYIKRPLDLPIDNKIQREMAKTGRHSVDCQIEIEHTAGVWRGRVCICSCEAEAFWSLACRSMQWIGTSSAHREPKRAEKPRFRPPNGDNWRPNREVPKDCLLSFGQVVDVLYPELFQRPEELPSGLIVFAGETSSGKSELLQQIIHRFLVERPKKKRHGGHLITLERPILHPIQDVPAGMHLPSFSLGLGLEVTRRQQGADFSTLEEALEDALRQKPVLVFIDEIRSAKEWSEVFAFANTGHLVATTAHAANVPIMLAKLLRQLEADTPSRRGEVARALYGVVHLRPTASAGLNVKLPSLWRNLEMGVSWLISPGLDSLVPTNPTGPSTQPYLGRTYFAKRFAKLLPKADIRDLITQARQWDLTEL